MSTKVEQGEDYVHGLLHYGTKGMKWGKRKDYTPTEVTVMTTPKGGVKTSGGKNQPVHKDSVEARVAVRKAKESGLSSLSNQELRTMATRINLEKNAKAAAGDQLTKNGKAFVDILLAVS